ncbi:MAG: hypothetical protein HY762_07545, partial [Planctomycetes bacterium]|nr:hypothetical protein [Planctomycetota bacterium]
LRGVKDVFESGRYEKTLEYGRKRYAQKWCEYLGPLKGYKAGGILGLSQMAIMALAGDRGLVDYLRTRDVRPEGEPTVITVPERINEFKNILANRIVRWGSEIIKLGYEDQDIKRANQELNQHVNEYCRPGIIPFTSGGDSHIDFIIVEIPNPVSPGQKAKCLGLDIQIAF